VKLPVPRYILTGCCEVEKLPLPKSQYQEEEFTEVLLNWTEKGIHPDCWLTENPATGPWLCALMAVKTSQLHNIQEVM
jgi:hypothetical protein